MTTYIVFAHDGAFLYLWNFWNDQKHHIYHETCMPPEFMDLNSKTLLRQENWFFHFINKEAICPCMHTHSPQPEFKARLHKSLAQTSIIVSVSQFSVALTDTKEQLIFQEGCPEILFKFVSQKKDFSCTPEHILFSTSSPKCFVKWLDRIYFAAASPYALLWY